MNGHEGADRSPPGGVDAQQQRQDDRESNRECRAQAMLAAGTRKLDIGEFAMQRRSCHTQRRNELIDEVVHGSTNTRASAPM